MREKESWLYRLLKRIGLIKTYELTKEEKEENCRWACASGVCTKACDRCLWGERKDNG